MGVCVYVCVMCMSVYMIVCMYVCIMCMYALCMYVCICVCV